MGSRIFTIYINDKEKVSEPLLGLLGFFDYCTGQWIKEETNSAIVDDVLHALTDIGYPWVVEFDYDTIFDHGTTHFENLEEWSKWYEN